MVPKEVFRAHYCSCNHIQLYNSFLDNSFLNFKEQKESALSTTHNLEKVHV